MYFQIKLNKTLLILFLATIVYQRSYGPVGVNANPYPEKPSDDSVVPEESPEDEPNMEEEEPAQESGGDSAPSQSALNEYMKEHPEVKQISTATSSAGAGNTKQVYNKFGDVVSVPIDTSAQKKKPVPPNPSAPADTGAQQEKKPLQLRYPYPYPYYNPFGLSQSQQMLGQSQGMGPSQGMMQMQSQQFQPPLPPFPLIPGQSPDKSKPAGAGKITDRINAEDKKTEKETPTMEQQIMEMMPEVNQNQSNKPMPNYFQFPPFQPYIPFPPINAYLQPNQYQIDKKNSQIMPMPLPNGMMPYPNLWQQLGSGAAQLDFANMRIVPQPLETTTEKPTPATESETMEDRPELPEVVVPKPKPKPKRKKLKKKLHSNRRKHTNRKDESQVKKPKFLMRARLNNLPKKSRNDENKWWTQPVPEYCSEAIFEAIDCEVKNLEKRWSFNRSDEKCYLYEDNCASVKKNTFKTLKRCMTTCWRPK